MEPDCIQEPSVGEHHGSIVYNVVGIVKLRPGSCWSFVAPYDWPKDDAWEYFGRHLLIEREKDTLDFELIDLCLFFTIPQGVNVRPNPPAKTYTKFIGFLN